MEQREFEYKRIVGILDDILNKMKSMEKNYQEELSMVHHIYKRSAQNLVHYLALRSFEIDKLDDDLAKLGLPLLSSSESHIMRSVLDLKRLVNSLLGVVTSVSSHTVSIVRGEKLLKKNTKLLFGYKSKKRRTRIMVTQPNTAAEDLDFVRKLLARGMNCARINCAHDDPEVWHKIIQNIRQAGKLERKKCSIAMDLGGPKLRTGPMVPGPKVVHIRPERDDLGRVKNLAKVWIAAPDVPPPAETEYQAFIPLEFQILSRMKRGNMLKFVDSRGKNCKIRIEKKDGNGWWGTSSDSAYLESGTDLILEKEKQSGKITHRVGELLPKEQFITLNIGDRLRLHKDQVDGENAKYNDEGSLVEMAHISCSLPEIFQYVKEGEPIYFDDGKIEGIAERATAEEIIVKITQAKDRGGKLKSDKGINLPQSDLKISGLTDKDREDIQFVAEHADAVNFSFVNTREDVLDLYEELKNLSAEIGVILKIETQKGFSNLPSILLAAMQSYPVGVMTARGDLAIETGWKNFPSIQQEIMRICSAAHIPNVWATQVLESLAKKGTPSRAEITDAAQAQQAECVMLNKGHYIHKAVKMLDKILRRMERFQRKSNSVIPKLEKAEELQVTHQAFDI